MTRHRGMLVLACAAALWCAVPLAVSATAQAGAVTVAGTWRTAIEVPGTGALNKGDADVGSVSCASAGNCAAGGNYTDSSGDTQAFVASERDGSWRRAIEVPGTGALNTGGFASVGSVSCGSAGNCLAGGATTQPATHTAPVTYGRSWPASGTAPGAGRSRCPASPR